MTNISIKVNPELPDFLCIVFTIMFPKWLNSFFNSIGNAGSDFLRNHPLHSSELREAGAKRTNFTLFLGAFVSWWLILPSNEIRHL